MKKVRIMGTGLLTATLLMSFFSSTAFAKRDITIAMVIDELPYVYYNEGILTGINIDILDLLFQEMDCSMNVLEMTEEKMPEVLDDFEAEFAICSCDWFEQNKELEEEFYLIPIEEKESAYGILISQKRQTMYEELKQSVLSIQETGELESIMTKYSEKLEEES